MIFAPRGLAFNVYLPLVAAGSGDFKTSPSIATGDGQFSKDDGALSNITPTVSPSGSAWAKFALSASDMDAGCIKIQMIDQTTPKEWVDTGCTIYTYGAGYFEGTIATATSTTVCTLSSEFPATTDALVDAAIEILSGANAGLSRQITAYTSGRVATFDAFPTTFTAGDRIRVGGVVK